MNRLLLPSPEAGSISGEPLFIPANFEEIVATAAFDYAARLNAKNRSRGGRVVLELTPEDQNIAIGVVIDAIQLAQIAKGQTVLPAKPSELRRTIKTGLELRETERLAAKQLVDELKQVAAIGGGKTGFYNLGLDEKLVLTAKHEVSNYPVTPRPANARKLMSMVTPRRQAVGQMAVVAATSYMADHQEDLSSVMPTDEFIARNLQFVRDLLDTEVKQAPVDRGAIIAASIPLIKKGVQLNPAFFESSDLELTVKAFGDSKIINALPELAAQTAGKLLIHSPELLPAGTDALEIFSRQILEAVRLSQKIRASRSKDPIASLAARSEILGILPTRPMLSSEALIIRAELLSTAKPDTHHLWENARAIPAGPNKSVLIPTPERLLAAKTFLGLGKIYDDMITNDRERLFQAIKAWRQYTLEKATLPGKIAHLNLKLKEISSPAKTKSLLPPDVIIELFPQQLETAILKQSGGISALTRRIKHDQAVLSDHRQLSLVAKNVDSPLRFAWQYLKYKQKLLFQKHGAVESEEEDQISGRGSLFILTDFPRRSLEGAASTAETPEEELTRIKGYLAELDADKSMTLPEIFLGDRQALWNYLRICQKKLPLHEKGQDRFLQLTSAMNILNKPENDGGGRNFLRNWFISEAEKRILSLTASLGRIKDFRANKAEMNVILDAMAEQDPDLIIKTAKKLIPGQHSVSLERWVIMQVVPPDFLKVPNLQLLDQAQAVVDLYRKAFGRVRMTIPHPNQIAQALEMKLKTTQNYKRADSRTASSRVINQLLLAWKSRNLLVPLGISEGARIDELIEATASRIAVARATWELGEFVAKQEMARKSLDELKGLKATGEKIISGKQLLARRNTMVRALETADFRFVETMRALHLAADPEMIPKPSPKK
jgi:hypothetical protein